MRRVVSLLALFCGVVVAVCAQIPHPQNAGAQNQAPAGSSAGAPAGAEAVPTPTLPPVPHETLISGVWREGKAVFSDVELLDIFTPYARGYKPEQPIKFNHRIHVEKNHMECQYCHSSVSKSSVASIPSTELCMGCHKLVRTDRPDIKILKDHFDKQKPVEWEPVNNLPEHAHFNHERHVKGGVGCQSCHGLVQKMDVVEKVSSLKMGFCVSCHRDRGVTIDCAACHY
ncbi:MAG: cytochrome c3 family protein [Deltaproteobacteria bacterium]|nr:cytochrome c3 family protein [Deltaproteobacteria bacterium]